jgi:hypothetical protein
LKTTRLEELNKSNLLEIKNLDENTLKKLKTEIFSKETLNWLNGNSKNYDQLLKTRNDSIEFIKNIDENT